MIIPQGGVHAASLETTPGGSRRAGAAALYRLGKRANPKFWAYRAIERRQYDPDRQARVVAVSNMVRGHLQQFHGVPRDADHA